MGLPQIVIDFKAKGETAVMRSQKGTAVLLFTRSEGVAKTAEYKSAEELDTNYHTKEELELLRLCFEQSPKRVIAVTLITVNGEINTIKANEELSRLNFNWLGVCTDKYDGLALNALLEKMRGKGRYVKAVFPFEYSFNSENVVVLSRAEVKIKEKAGSQMLLVPIVTGLLSYLPLGESATYKRISAVEKYTALKDESSEIENGRLVLIEDDLGYKIARGVNSLVSLSPSLSGEMKKIKIAEAVDAIRTDIKQSLESSYIGRVKNDYDSKLLLCGAINGYFDSLGDAILDKSYDNKASISLERQRGYLALLGIDTDNMTDTEILKANTGAYVFLQASIRFVDAMEDVVFTLEM